MRNAEETTERASAGGGAGRGLLVNPVTGESFRFTRTAEQTGGELLRAEFVAPPGWRQAGPLQSHPNQEERILVISGSLRVRGGGAGHVLRAGGWLEVPPGTAHSVVNEGPEEARAVLEWRPALETRQFFETLFGLSREGRVRTGGAPRNPLQLAVWLDGFKREVRPAGAAGAPLRLALPLLAWLGRRLGFRRHYPRYGAGG